MALIFSVIFIIKLDIFTQEKNSLNTLKSENLG